MPPDLPSFDTEGTIGCQKIDVLFVVDDTGDLSSGLDQTLAIKSAKRVTDSANELLAVLQAQQFDYDLQVMVVKGDEHWEGKSKQCCEPGEFCGQEAPYPACNGVPIKDLTLCDSTLGAGVVYPVGFMASNVKCPMSEGRRYIGAGDDLASLFDCVIKVGRTGGDQDIPGAMLGAVSPELAGSGGCNDGFLRRDAMLLVVLLSEGLEDNTPGAAEAWAAELVAAKGGDAGAVVVAGVLRTVDVADDGHCYNASNDQLRKMVEMMPAHVLGSICAPDLGVYLAGAIDVINTACTNYVPPQG